MTNQTNGNGVRLLFYAESGEGPKPPIATLSLVGVCFVFFGLVAAVTLSNGPELPIRWFASLGIAPGSGRWHTFLTYWVLHEHLWHLSLNMLLLFVFGSCLEGGVGWRAFLGLFLTGAVLTGAAEAIAAQYAPVHDSGAMIIGASGAVATVLGAFVSRYRSTRVRVTGIRLGVQALPLIAGLALAEVGAIGYQALVSPEHLPTAAHWAHILGFLYGISWDQTASALTAKRRGVPSRATSVVVDVGPGDSGHESDHWEAVLAGAPSDSEALVQLPLALAAEGDWDRAHTSAGRAVAEALERHDRATAVTRYMRLRSLDPHSILEERLQLDLAGSLADGHHFEEAVHVFHSVTHTSPDPSLRAQATVRAAACLLRYLHQPEKAHSLLTAFLTHATDDDWRAYATKLLREADAALRVRRNARDGDSPWR